MRRRFTLTSLVLGVAVAVTLTGVSVAAFGCAPSTTPAADGRPTTPGVSSPVPGGDMSAEVTRVIDGDTIVVLLPDGSEERVRYIGLDAPEEPREGAPGEPLSAEATAANEDLVAGGSVRLAFDRDVRDDFERLLAYVYVSAEGAGAEVFVNEELVRRGLADARSYPPNTARDADLAAAEREARAAKRGIWGLPGE